MDEDPYAVLQLDRATATLEDVKRAYFYIAKLYSPDQGGNPQQFERFQQAYQSIMAQRQQQQAQQPFMEQGRFSQDLFNDRFRQRTKPAEEDGYVYNIDDSNYRERTKQQFEREHAKITQQAESVTPMFRPGQFNPNAFHRMFTHLKSKHQVDEPAGPPQPVPGTQIMAYSNVDNLREGTNVGGSLVHSDYERAFGQNHANPTEISSKMVQKMGRMQDITKADPMSESEARKRMAQRNSQPIQYNRDPLNTSVDHFMSDGMGGGSGMGDVSRKSMSAQQEGTMQEHMHRKMMELRMQPSQMGFGGGNASGGMIPYPTNSHTETPSLDRPQAIRDTSLLYHHGNDLLPSGHNGYPPTSTPMAPPPVPPVQPAPPALSAAIPGLTMAQQQSLAQQQTYNKQLFMHQAKEQEMRDTIKVQQRMISKLLRQKKRR